MHLVIYTWSRRLAEVQHHHRDGEERELKWLWRWWTLWLVADGMWVFYKLLLISWVFHHITTVSRVHREPSQKEKIPNEPLLCSMGIYVLLKSGVGGQNAQTGWRPQKGNTISHNQWSQPGSTLRNVWTPTTLKQKAYKYLVNQHSPGTLRGT